MGLMGRRGNLIVSSVFFVFARPPPHLSSLSSEKRTDKQAMNGIVVCSAEQVGEVNKSTVQGLSTGWDRLSSGEQQSGRPEDWLGMRRRGETDCR